MAVTPRFSHDGHISGATDVVGPRNGGHQLRLFHPAERAQRCQPLDENMRQWLFLELDIRR